MFLGGKYASKFDKSIRDPTLCTGKIMAKGIQEGLPALHLSFTSSEHLDMEIAKILNFQTLTFRPYQYNS